MGKRLTVLLLLIFAAYRAPAQVVQRDTLPHISIKTVPSDFAVKHLGYFCHKELQLQKLTRTSLFIRLGSKEYVDYLEQKPNAARRF